MERAVRALVDRSADDFEAAATDLRTLFGLRDFHRATADRLASLRREFPAVADLLPVSSDSPWAPRLVQLGDAWEWLQLDRWLTTQQHLDPNRIQRRILEVEDQVRRHVASLAATRAWRHAVRRLTAERRADLAAFVTLVKRLGKGTGRHADRRRAEIQHQLDRSRDSVPVWIMPLYRVAESMTAKQNAYDVIIVDEASQAGLEGLMLTYLAPTVVVVGDDKQVSPTSFVEQERVYDLVDRHLRWSPQRAVYADPARSLFDEAKMRFPDLIMLTEHRRCVPDIIGFSDMIAYEPDGDRLQPVREVGTDALQPLVVTRLVDGVQRGKKNEREIETIIELVSQCVADPRYEGKSIGVISLLGAEQAKPIAAGLLDKLGPDLYQKHEIRCGEPPNFQGAERDVVFLSMVSSNTAEKKGKIGETRVAALTATQFVQRYNVAVSRAKDQVHLVHSLEPNTLKPEDLRSRLIGYMTERAAAVPEIAASTPVGLDEPDRRFPSMLAQQVHDLLAVKGYHLVRAVPRAGRTRSTWWSLAAAGRSGSSAWTTSGPASRRTDE